MNVYTKLVELLRAGARLDPDAVSSILAACGRDWRSLAVDAVLRPHSPRPGDKCDCGGRLVVYCTKKRGAVKVQYLRCGACHRRPSRNKVLGC